ncbi:YciI family protein [Bradyrhizobium sp. SRS-191]|uniref:YciI family protein n=1 Tax=Bradyrhizobium sp. SRS-191 TaxID=2962606 RepID=UPI00211EE642|nr:YciI family protein [Bradyrhizobium sp. SRS-191]
MRFMAIVKATQDSEAGVLPTSEEFAEMGRFNEGLIKAGMMETGEGLHPTARGARIDFSAGEPRVAHGPFKDTGDLVGGYWIIKAASLDQVIDAMTRAPFPSGQVEIRRIYAAEDFGEALTPELRAQEDRLRALAGNG